MSAKEDLKEFLVATALTTVVGAVLLAAAWLVLRPWLIEQFIVGESLWMR